jgi:hypothetical protein
VIEGIYHISLPPSSLIISAQLNGNVNLRTLCQPHPPKSRRVRRIGSQSDQLLQAVYLFELLVHIVKTAVFDVAQVTSEKLLMNGFHNAMQGVSSHIQAIVLTPKFLFLITQLSVRVNIGEIHHAACTFRFDYCRIQKTRAFSIDDRIYGKAAFSSDDLACMEECKCSTERLWSFGIARAGVQNKVDSILQRKLVDHYAELWRQFHEREGFLRAFAVGSFGGDDVWMMLVLASLHTDCERAYRLVRWSGSLLQWQLAT